MAGFSQHPTDDPEGPLQIHNHHHAVSDSPASREIVLGHLQRIPWGWAQKNWWDYKVASKIDRECFHDPKKKSFDHVYVVDASIEAGYAPLLIAVCEEIWEKEADRASSFAVYLLEFIIMLRRELASGKDVIRWVYVGIGGTGIINATARFLHHFTLGKPDSLHHLVLLAVSITNDILTEDDTQYEIIVNRSIIASCAELPLDEFNWDYAAVLEIVLCSLLGGAVQVGGSNVASCGMPPLLNFVKILEELQTLDPVFPLRQLLDTPPPDTDPWLPTSIAMVVTACAVGAQRVTGQRMDTVVDLLAYLRQNQIDGRAARAQQIQVGLGVGLDDEDDEANGAAAGGGDDDEVEVENGGGGEDEDEDEEDADNDVDERGYRRSRVRTDVLQVLDYFPLMRRVDDIAHRFLEEGDEVELGEDSGDDGGNDDDDEVEPIEGDELKDDEADDGIEVSLLCCRSPNLIF
jgi:hypothetical protein